MVNNLEITDKVECGPDVKVEIINQICILHLTVQARNGTVGKWFTRSKGILDTSS